MWRSIWRVGVGCGLLLGLFAPAYGQNQDFVLPYLKSPETAPEFWAALKYELQLGNQKRAATMLKEFYDKFAALGEEDQTNLLLRLYDTDGLSAILKLQNLPFLRSVTAKVGDKDVPIGEILVDRVTKAVHKRVGDPGRLAFFVGNLNKSNEERAYAIAQLRQAGPLAVPFMVNVLRDGSQKANHKAVVNAFLQMDQSIVPPLLAALDSPDVFVRTTVLSVLLQRGDKAVTPYLWYLYGQPGLSPETKQLVLEGLSRFSGIPKDKIAGDPKVMLTREAERYYHHQVSFVGGDNQTIWRWNDQDGVVGQPANRNQMEEYYGIYWAKKALELDPSYRPAQVVLLSIALEKSFERGGIDQPLAKSSPELAGVLAASGSSLLEAVLDRALAEGRTATALGAIQALGPTNDARLVRGTEQGLPPLVRALSYPDRRVQLAAADALLQLPVPGTFPGASRVVEVLRKSLNSENAARAIIATPNSEDGQKLAATLRSWKFEPLVTASGKEAFRQASAAGNVEAVFLDSRISDPPAAELVGQFRASADTAGVPIIILSKDNGGKTLSALARYPRVLMVSPVPATDELLKLQVQPFLQDAFRAPLTDAERKAQAQTAAKWLVRMAQGEKSGYDIRQVDAALYTALASDDLAAPAATVLATRPDAKAQQALADAVLSAMRPPEVRAEAARQLRLSLARFGKRLSTEQTANLAKLATTAEDAAVREEVARLAAGFTANATLEGNRLKQFEPGAPKQPQPAPEKPAAEKPAAEKPAQEKPEK